jgi:selenocysteine lyase/cysteine desulfurase
LVETEWESFEDAIARGARLAVLSTANYTNGFRPPLEAISRLCRQHGTLLYVDGTQSVGALTTDLSRVQPSLMAVHGYKWMLSPNGAAFLYVSPEVREWLEPNVVGWRSDSGWREVDHLSHGVPIFMNSAEKYEGGGLNFPSLYAMDVSVQMMLELGPAVIEQRVLQLAGLVRDSLRRLGATLASDSSPYFNSPIVAARFPGRDASEIARALAAHGVIVSARHGNLRVSTHFYNTAEDVAQLEKGLADLL